MVDGCACAVGASGAWDIPWRYNWGELNGGITINNPGDCGEGSGVFNTACPNCPVGC